MPPKIDDSTPIRSEAELIETYLAPLAAGFPGAFGLSDDCAIAAPRAGHEFVFKTDAIAAGVHFLPDDAPEDIAWKALAVNVSDLAAKAAEPVAYLLSLAFPDPPTHGWMRRFAAGLDTAQAAFGLSLMGGDTDRRPGPLAITPMVVGELPAGTLKRRSAARPGDRIYVSGTLGDAALGLALLRDRDLQQRLMLAPDDAAFLIHRYRRPEPRLALMPALRAAANATMDLSDGIVKDLGRLCRAAGLGARIVATDIPLSGAVRAALRTDPAWFHRVVSAGDDYEILATVPPERAEEFERLAAAARASVTCIGCMTSTGALHVVDQAGQVVDFPRSGWDHF